jgi:murein DD-endopeptidase MepM/ murein hydrolase activator NlpD
LVNDRHPSGTATPPAPAPDAASAHYASYGQQGSQYGDFTTYDGYSTTGFDANATGAYDATGTYATTAFETDPLFGDLPGAGTGSYDATQWSTGSHGTLGEHHQTPHYDPYTAQHLSAYDTGSYETTGIWPEATGYQPLAEIPTQAAGPEATGQWDANAWHQAEPVDQNQQWSTQTFDTGAYDATAWNSDGDHQPHESYDQHESYEHESYDQQATAAFEHIGYDEPMAAKGDFTPSDDPDTSTGTSADPGTGTGTHEDFPPLDGVEGVEGVEEISPVTATIVAPAPRSASRSAGRGAARSRRRTPPKRSALLTVVVPSACVVGVAGIAAASVGAGSESDAPQTTAAPDASAVKPSAANNKLDTQLESLSAGADDFADRASRTQERIDLKAQQEAEKKRAAAEAARKERLRPKFALPVAQKGLSAYYGQSGINWMSVHTGIDFPVSYGTTVMAATDGTIRTEWNSAYGNMAVVTAKDGTETWYCHLSSYKVASGTAVKAGDPIAFSGNSGNSTGPHLHFEVHPGGGDAIDPLPWLRSHGLNPN